VLAALNYLFKGIKQQFSGNWQIFFLLRLSKFVKRDAAVFSELSLFLVAFIFTVWLAKWTVLRRKEKRDSNIQGGSPFGP